MEGGGGDKCSLTIDVLLCKHDKICVRVCVRARAHWTKLQEPNKKPRDFLFMQVLGENGWVWDVC